MSTILYTDVGRVIRALTFQAPEIVGGSNALSIGDTQITVNQNTPTNWQNGDTLAIDGNNEESFELVTITNIPSTTTLTVTALTKNHALGAPVVNVTAVLPYPSSASRWFDSVTFNKFGFGYEIVTEKKTAYITNEGFITVPLSKPMVNIDNVMDATFQSTPLDPIQPLDLSKAWIEDDYFLNIVATNPYSRRQGQIEVTYSGGYDHIPDDIAQAVTIMAARFYKERDSGYSDMIGSAETGLVSYKKAMPADVKVIVDKYRRWTE